MKFFKRNFNRGTYACIIILILCIISTICGYVNPTIGNIAYITFIIMILTINYCRWRTSDMK